MPMGSRWRSSSRADDFASLDYADFAQEFLRRNDDYRRDYRQMMQSLREGQVAPTAACEDLARRWGMDFPMRSRHPGDHRPRTLVP